MITGIILIIISVISFYVVYTTDLEDDVVENEFLGRLKLYIGIAIIFVFGIVSMLNNL